MECAHRLANVQCSLDLASTEFADGGSAVMSTSSCGERFDQDMAATLDNLLRQGKQVDDDQCQVIAAQIICGVSAFDKGGLPQAVPFENAHGKDLDAKQDRCLCEIVAQCKMQSLQHFLTRTAL